MVALVVLALVQMRSGVRELQVAKGLIVVTRSTPEPQVVAAATLHLVAAHNDFEQARLTLAVPGPLLAALGWVPLVGGDMAALPPAADAGYFATGAALHLDAGLTPLVEEIRQRSGPASSMQRLALGLGHGRSEFVAAAGDAAFAEMAVAALPPDAVHLRGMEPRLSHDVQMLRAGATWALLAPGLLGATGARRYLFAWEDPMELRATGGFIGASDLITLRGGAVSHRFSGRLPSPHEIDTALPPLPESAYTPETYWVFSDSNWSPDFPVTARLERWFYGEDTGLWADGVINFVDTGIRGILRATGPLYLPAYGRRVTASNVEELAQQYINGTYKGPSQAGLRDDIRKQFFHHVMAALQARIEGLPLSRWPALGRALVRLVQTHDLLIYSRNPEVQSAIVDMGADGAMLRTSGDYLYVVDDNRSYNKINPYVHESIAVKVATLPSGAVDHVLTIRYHVDRSPARLIGYGPGLGTLSLRAGHGPSLGGIGSKHDYADFLRVFVPKGSVLYGLSGLDRWAPQLAYGRTQFSGRVVVKSGRSATVIVRYRTPMAVTGASRLTVQHQPGAHIDRLTVHLPRGLGRRTNWNWHDPRTDLSIPAVSSATLVPTPSASSSITGIDPSIPFQSLRDVHHSL
jgi:hypothetical protein